LIALGLRREKEMTVHIPETDAAEMQVYRLAPSTLVRVFAESSFFEYYAIETDHDEYVLSGDSVAVRSILLPRSR